MRRHWSAITASLFVLLASGADVASALTWTCSTVVRRGITDPIGQRFVNRFDDPSINLPGDVIFLARPAGGRRAVYLYPAAGIASVVAARDDAAPGGGVFRTFGSPSINDDRDLGFFGDLTVGEGVYVRQSGNNLVKAAATGDASPGGGTFESFEFLSRVNAAGDIAFMAVATGGPSGIFLYDVSSGSLSTVVLIGGATGDGRQFCSLLDVGLGDSGSVSFLASTKVSCADILEQDLGSVHLKVGATFTTVAREGQPTPIGGTTYDLFFDTLTNDADKVGFRARTAGTLEVMGVFLFDPAGPSTTKLVATGDGAPGAGGTIKTIPFIELTDGDRTSFRGKVLNGTSKHGTFLFDGSAEAVVLDTDPVPVDLYGAGSTYRKIFEQQGTDRSGSRVTFTAKVRDSVAPRSKTGVFRCTGT